MFHLALASEWKAGWRAGQYTPARFETDGFVHCCDDAQTTLKVAAAYFSGAAEEVLVIELDEALLGVEVKREAPVSVDGAVHAHHDGRVFPHVYGPIPAAAVVRVVPLRAFP
ncbi:MAG: DUF952 domain-containing protein [Archangium sp.]|nr:DUF952 domain-containing protein [Archangium sp.]